ncbi:hypothetical protein [Oceanicaulis sp.]|uniref:hypothetical protein n=1 Tax=Oceanicaulis sp. TaxID=1924941 RepID=UPI003D2A2634
MLNSREIEALDQAGLSPELRDEVVAQAQGQIWVRFYRLFAYPWWLFGLAALALLVNTQTRDVISPGLLMTGMIPVPLVLVMLLATTLSWSPNPAVRFRNRLVRLSINATWRWGGHKARLDLEELAAYLDGAENAEAGLVVLDPYRRKRRYYHTTVAMGLGLFAITIAFFTIGLPLMLGLG